MSLIIRHNKDREEYSVGKETSTVVMQKPEVNEIFQELRKQFTKSCLKRPVITVNIGGAFVHAKDAFNKKLGRSLAQSRIKPLEMNIEVGDYQHSDEAIWIVLRGIDRSLEVAYTVTMKVYRDSGESRIMGISTRSWR